MSDWGCPHEVKGLCQKLNNHRLKPVGLNYGLKVRIRVA